MVSQEPMKKRPRVDRDQPARSDCSSPPPSPNSKKLKMVCASFYVPKHNEHKPLSDDAHFICAYAETVGVADGVGGWARLGIDSGKYARELMDNASLAVLLRKDKTEAVDPGAILREAYTRTTAAEVEGSSTACLLSHGGGILRSANVGDSGFMIFRRNRLVYRSRTQQWGYNCPYQLGSSEGSDRPGCAAEMKIAMVAGDVVVLGTDGFLDNVFPSEVEEILDGELAKEGRVDLAEVASIVAEIALYNSFDKFRDSPFSKAAKRAGRSHKGGKIDDITVVVGLIVVDDDDDTATK